MARIIRSTSILFGSTAPATDIEQFGSKQQTGIPNYTTSVSVIQSLAAWTNGWSSAIVTADKAPYKQDVNAVDYVLSTFVSYILQQGIAEWDAGTTYYALPNPSVVQYNNGYWYQSLQDNNTGNAPPVGASNAFWKFIILPPTLPTRTVKLSGAGTYFIPTNPSPQQITIRMVGAGGGGGAATTNPGSPGGVTSFNGIVANGGNGGSQGGVYNGGTGGSGGAGAASFRIGGGGGGSSAGGGVMTGAGGASAFGGGGAGIYQTGVGIAGAVNSGGGGGGGGTGGNNVGGGGGAGEYVEIVINPAPAASYAYSVGAAGAGGAPGGNAGGAGGSGIIIIDEDYH